MGSRKSRVASAAAREKRPQGDPIYPYLNIYLLVVVCLFVWHQLA